MAGSVRVRLDLLALVQLLLLGTQLNFLAVGRHETVWQARRRWEGELEDLLGRLRPVTLAGVIDARLDWGEQLVGQR